MEQVRSQQLIKAQELLAANKYNESLQVLDTIDVAQLDSSQQGEYYLIKSECLLFLGSCGHDYPDRAINSLKFGSQHKQFAKAKYLKGWQKQLQGDRVFSKEAMLEAYAAFMRVDEYAEAARVLNRLSYWCHSSGEYSQAIENLKRCIVCCEKLKDLRRVQISKFNLAMVLLRTGAVREAIDLYSDIEAHSDCLEEMNKAAYMLGFALATSLKGEIKKGNKLLKEVFPLLSGYNREKAQYFEHTGSIALLNGEYTKCEKALKAGLKIAIEIASQSNHISQIKRLFGDLYVATGKYKLAEKYAKEALEVATHLNERLEIAACYRVFAQVAAKSNENDKAKQHFAEALNIFNQIEARYEHAVTLYVAAVSDLYEAQEKAAMLYMARTYFESEQIQPYLDKIDTALAEIKKSKVSASGGLRSHQQNDGADRRSVAHEYCPDIITRNEGMKKLLALAAQIAPSQMNVLLTGETGTGKDLLARFLHYHSGRSGQFVTINAAAIPQTMIEAELFGYSRGAFTGADKDRPGLLEMADGGTFYLNEIADASPEFQAKLLEVLETREIRRLGENKTRRVDFRLIAATNGDLRAMMNKNEFRLDLFHRLNEIPICLPPLRDRLDDIEPLIEFFLRQTGFNVNGEHSQRLTKLAELMSFQEWPGNIRQLQALVKQYSTNAAGDLDKMLGLMGENHRLTPPEILKRCLELASWNRSQAAAMLGVSEGTVRYWIKQYDLRPVENV